jgi:hypothetical protein
MCFFLIRQSQPQNVNEWNIYSHYESRKIVEAAHSDTLEPNVLLNMILQIVTNIDKRIEIMETTMIKSVDWLMVRSKGYFYYETVIYLLWVQSPIRSKHLWTVFENVVSICNVINLFFLNKSRSYCTKIHYLITFYRPQLIDQDDVHFSFAKI